MVWDRPPVFKLRVFIFSAETQHCFTGNVIILRQRTIRIALTACCSFSDGAVPPIAKMIGRLSIENHHFSGEILIISAFPIESSKTSWHIDCNSQDAVAPRTRGRDFRIHPDRRTEQGRCRGSVRPGRAPCMAGSTRGRSRVHVRSRGHGKKRLTGERQRVVQCAWAHGNAWWYSSAVTALPNP